MRVKTWSATWSAVGVALALLMVSLDDAHGQVQMHGCEDQCTEECTILNGNIEHECGDCPTDVPTIKCHREAKGYRLGGVPRIGDDRAHANGRDDDLNTPHAIRPPRDERRNERSKPSRRRRAKDEM